MDSTFTWIKDIIKKANNFYDFDLLNFIISTQTSSSLNIFSCFRFIFRQILKDRILFLNL